MFGHKKSERFPSKVHPGRDLLTLRSRCGAEFWGSVDTKINKLTGGPDPHFSGLSRMRMKVTKKLQDGDEVMFHGEARDMLDKFPKQDEEVYVDEEGNLHINKGIQFQFQCPASLRCGKELQVPSQDDERGLYPILTAQVAAFAHQIEVFDSLDDYEAHNKKRREEDDKAFTFDDKSFACFSIWDKQTDEANPEQKLCFFTGRVLQVKERLNEYTGELYYWALVETAQDLKFDVVIHPDLLDPQHPPRVGRVVQGIFFLSAHFCPDDVDD